MKAIKYVAATAALTLSSFAMADGNVIKSGSVFEANKLIPAGVRAEVGTTGYGGALLWEVNPYVGLALGYNGGDISWSDDLKVNGTKYDMDMDNKTAYLNAELRPWGASDNTFAKSVYVAAGVGFVDNQYDLTRRSSDGSITVNGTKYLYDGSINGKRDYKNDIAPYVGFGISPKFSKNWGVFGEVGAYYTGNPDVSLVGNGKFTNVNGGNKEQFDKDLAVEENKIRNDDKYKWLPVGKVGVNFYW